MTKEELKEILKEMFKDGTIVIDVHAWYFDGHTDSSIRITIDKEQVYFKRN